MEIELFKATTDARYLANIEYRHVQTLWNDPNTTSLQKEAIDNFFTTENMFAVGPKRVSLTGPHSVHVFNFLYRDRVKTMYLFGEEHCKLDSIDTACDKKIGVFDQPDKNQLFTEFCAKLVEFSPALVHLFVEHSPTTGTPVHDTSYLSTFTRTIYQMLTPNRPDPIVDKNVYFKQLTNTVRNPEIFRFKKKVVSFVIYNLFNAFLTYEESTDTDLLRVYAVDNRFGDHVPLTDIYNYYLQLTVFDHLIQLLHSCKTTDPTVFDVNQVSTVMQILQKFYDFYNLSELFTQILESGDLYGFLISKSPSLLQKFEAFEYKEDLKNFYNNLIYRHILTPAIRQCVHDVWHCFLTQTWNPESLRHYVSLTYVWSEFINSVSASLMNTNFVCDLFANIHDMSVLMFYGGSAHSDEINLFFKYLNSKQNLQLTFFTTDYVYSTIPAHVKTLVKYGDFYSTIADTTKVNEKKIPYYYESCPIACVKFNYLETLHIRAPAPA
ncbi:hypothetical protein EBS02_06985, partial [bacterium]|nr:hypothetical protein [bacterium]